jgi:gas vesicle protein
MQCQIIAVSWVHFWLVSSWRPIGAVALLNAPQSGEETRKYISDKSIELKNTAVEKAEQARAKAEAAAVEAQHYAEDIKARSQEIIEKAVPRNKRSSCGDTRRNLV